MVTENTMATFICSYSTGSEELALPTLKDFVKHLLQTGVISSQPVVKMKPPLGARDETQQGESGTVKERSMLSIRLLKKVIKDEDIDVNQTETETGLTVLTYSCFLGREDVAKLLIKKGADHTLTDNNGWGPLHYAAWGQNINCLKFLLSTSSSTLVNAKDDRGITPLMIAAYKCGLDIIQLLIKKGGDPFIVDANNRTILHWAVTSKQVDIVKYFLDKYFNKEDKARADIDGATPLHYAVVMDTIEILNILLSEGFDPLSQDAPPTAKDAPPTNQNGIHYSILTDGLTPVHWACALSLDTVLTSLLDSEVGVVNVLSRQQLTPLHMVACIGSVDLCKKLIEYGAMVDAKDSSGITPLYLACHYGHTDCVKLLLDRQANVNRISSAHKMSGLHVACQKGHDDLVDYLVRSGADRDIASGLDGSSPIHLGAIFGHSRVIEKLLKQKCNVDLLRETDGRTCLHLSASNGHLECCQLLIKNGANVDVTDNTTERYGPLDLAVINNHRECSDFLILHKARTHGGKAHRAACTIQLSWRYHVHKRQRRTTLYWATVIIQHTVRKWLLRRKAKRLKELREKKRQESAVIIQKEWREYINRKRLLEESYHALKTKLNHEYVATHLILSELNQHKSNIHLPPAVPHSNPHSHTASLLRSSRRFPLFSNELTIFEQQPKKPLFRLINKPKSRANTIPPTTRLTDNLTVPTVTNSHTHRSIITSKNVNQDSIIGSARHIALEPDNNNIVQIGNRPLRGSPCHTTSLECDNNNNNNLGTGSTDVKLPAIKNGRHSNGGHQYRHLLVNNPQTKKETSSSLPPLETTKPSLVRSKRGGNGNRTMATTASAKQEKKGRDKREEREKIEKKKATKSVDDSVKLLQQAKRYEKLQQVAVLLEHANTVKSTSADGEGYEELKEQIQSALEEAIRLRVDTEALCDTSLSL